MATVYSNVVSGSYWRAYITYSTSYDLSNYKVTISGAGVNVPNSGSWVQYPFKATLAATSQTTITNSISSTTITGPASKAIISNKTFTWARSTTENLNRTITLTIDNTYNGKSAEVSFSVTVPQRTKSTITYNANGATSGTMTATTYWNATSGTVALKKNNFTRTGYSFVGWHRTKAQATAGNKEYSDGQSWNLKNTGNYTLYAAWKPYKLTVNYYKGTATSVDSEYNKSPMNTQTREYGDTLNLVNHSTYGLARTNYHRVDGKEWYQTVDGTKTYYDQDVDYALSRFADIRTSNKTVSLYPNFEENTYTVTFNANGGSGAPSAQTKYATTALTLSTTQPSRTNYNFLGWSKSSTATSATWRAGGSFTDNANTTLYAVWQLNAVNVTTYRYNSPNSSYSKKNYNTVKESVPAGGSKTVIPANVTGYFGFIGWIETTPKDVYPYSTTSIGTKILVGNSEKKYWAAYRDITPTSYKSTNIDCIRVNSNASFNDYITAINNNDSFDTVTDDTTLLFGYIEFPAGCDVTKIANRNITITPSLSNDLTLNFVNSSDNSKLFFSIETSNDEKFQTDTAYKIIFTGNDDQGKPISETVIVKKRTILVDIQPTSIGLGVPYITSENTLHLRGNGLRIHPNVNDDSVYSAFSSDGVVSLPNDLNVAGNIYVNGHASAIGATSTTAGTSITVKTGTDTSICSHLFTPGTWVIRCALNFTDDNTTGDRLGVLSTSVSTSGAYNRYRASAGSSTRFVWVEILNLSTSTTYYLVAWQNSGSDVSVNGRINWVRIC